jgi:diguanylate cyclase (GGDEF)-like protein
VPRKVRRGPPRSTLILPAAFLLVVAALPWLSDRVDTGHWPRTPREVTSEVIGSGITLVLGWWILSLLRREQRVDRHYLEELENLTLTDPLTGLGNRRALGRDLPVALKRADRQGGPLALLYMDVDQLKHINDRFGHAAGDETLRALGAVLRSCSRVGTDVAYRVGGDEFVMTLVTDGKGAELLAERVKREFHARSPRGSQLSLGVVVWDGRMSAGQLLDEADSRMYESRLPGWARRRA